MIIKKKLKHLFGIVDIPSIPYNYVLGDHEIKIIQPIDKPGGLTLEELAIVIGIAKNFNVSKIFEIGSFRGRTAINLLHNNPYCNLTTLDLPDDPESLNNLKYSLHKNDLKIAQAIDRGVLIKNYPEYQSRVKSLLGDSATFNFDKEYANYDLVFIDGSHRYENVLKDSENAVKLLKNDNGIILWHDYSKHSPGVIKAVREFKKNNNFDIFHIKRTKLAFLKLS